MSPYCSLMPCFSRSLIASNMESALTCMHAHTPSKARAVARRDKLEFEVSADLYERAIRKSVASSGHQMCPPSDLPTGAARYSEQ